MPILQPYTAAELVAAVITADLPTQAQVLAALKAAQPVLFRGLRHFGDAAPGAGGAGTGRGPSAPEGETP